MDRDTRELLLPALLRVAGRFAAEGDPDALLYALLEETTALFGAGVVVYRWDEAAEQMVPAVSNRVADAAPVAPNARGLGVSGRVAETRRPVIVNDYQSAFGTRTAAGRGGIRAGLGAPMLHGDRLLGCLAVGSFADGAAFTEGDAAVLAALAELAAAALVGQERVRQAEADARAQREQERSALVASLVHDLGTPLTAIVATAQALQRRAQRGDVSPEQLGERLGVIAASGQRMAALLQELRAPAEDSLPARRREAVDLVELARQVASEQQGTTERHQLRVEASAPSLVGWWDRARLERVLANLLANAIKYSPDGGEVLVRVGHEGDEAVLAVADRGIGIPAAELPRVFGRAYRASNAADAAEGSGLGLAVARLIVEQHGGSLQAASREGQGSTFTVRLPLGAGGRAWAGTGTLGVRGSTR